MFKKTSINGIVFPTSARPAGAILGDFDIDGAILKPDHTTWLDKHIVDPAMARKGTAGSWQIDLIGHTSRSGSDNHNLQLSNRRVQAVQSYLMPRLAGIPVHVFPAAEGESRPVDWSQYENELDRSVEVRAAFNSVSPKRRTIPRLIPKTHIWKPRENRKVRDFTFTVLKANLSIFGVEFKAGFIGITNGTAGSKLLIRIDETGTPDFALYNFEATGPGSILAGKPSLKAAKPGLGVNTFSSSYTGGETRPFAMDFDLDAQDFGGPGLFQFDAAGNTIAFGPTEGFFSGRKKIRGLDLGRDSSTNLLKYGEGTTAGKLELVTSTPEWAR